MILIRRILSLAAITVAALVLLAGCSSYGGSPETRTEIIFATTCTISLYDHQTDQNFQGAFDILKHIDAEMSFQRQDSNLSQLNRASGTKPISVPSELYDVIKKGIAFSKLSGGAFDITIGPLTGLWGIGTDHAKVPTQEQINKALSLIDYREVMMVDDHDTVLLEKKGMKIDLGGIAKGFAADKVTAYLEKQGVRGAIVNLGGNIYALGTRKDGLPWRIGIQNPTKERGQYVGIVDVKDTSVVTSGPYERYFIENGVRYDHLLSTKTGFPVKNDLSSVTIICKSSITADALSTTVFVLGVKKGLDLVRSYDGVQAIILTDDDKVYVTDGIRNSFRITDPAYTIAGDEAPTHPPLLPVQTK